MRRVVLIVPDWLGTPEDESVLRQKLPALARMTENGSLSKLSPPPDPLPSTRSFEERGSSTPEAAWLGLDPRSVDLRQGPLTVAALGADPPNRSVHFHLSLLSHEDGVIRELEHEVPSEQLEMVAEQFERLNTRKLTIVRGEDRDHGLVWEDGSIEMRTWGPAELGGPLPPAPSPVAGISHRENGEGELRSHLPEGDGETILRRLIDDSINLLTELPFNEERMDQGLQPINLLWPWGQGICSAVPNLLLQRGERAFVESGSLRLQGLARLVKYAHGDRRLFGKGVNVRLEELAAGCLARSLTIVVLEAMSALRAKGMVEEMAWLTNQIDSRFLAPLLDQSLREPFRVSVLAPSAAGGLAVVYEGPSAVGQRFPFDERALDESEVRSSDAWSVVDESARFRVGARSSATSGEGFLQE